VLGEKGAKLFAESFGAEVVLLDNAQDHLFNPAFPNRPIVCNRDQIEGLSNRRLIDAVGLPIEI
jgi:hypothetical protein